MVISCKLRFDANSEQVGRGDLGGEREERDEQQEHQVQPHEVGVGGFLPLTAVIFYLALSIFFIIDPLRHMRGRARRPAG